MPTFKSDLLKESIFDVAFASVTDGSLLSFLLVGCAVPPFVNVIILSITVLVSKCKFDYSTLYLTYIYAVQRTTFQIRLIEGIAFKI